MCTLYTIGYEGTDKESFINQLIENDIETLIDVREIPLSRKPGFSKTKLSNLLEENGIKYLHYRQLGSPKDLRHKLYKDKDYETFFQEYRIHANSVIDDVIEVMRIVEKSDSCLLCFENNPNLCHRSILADIMQSYSSTIDSIINIK